MSEDPAAEGTPPGRDPRHRELPAAPSSGAPTAGSAAGRSTGRSRGCRSGCLWGCGALLALGLVLAVAGYLAWETWAAPLLGDLEAQVKGYLPGDLKPPSLTAKVPDSQEGSHARADFPSGVWLPEGATRAAYRILPGAAAPTEALAVLRFVPPPESPLGARLKQELRARGWTKKGRRTLSDGTLLRYRKGKQRLSITLRRSPSELQLWVRWKVGH